ncbi:MAG: TonB-dependent receptor [Lysobacter sp.]|nr:TonB-dependent receptor [Lysobacter sp.]
MVKFPLYVGAALVALTASATTNAQSTADTDARNAPSTSSPAADEADIVVTAQRRSERLQDVPIAVSALSGDTLVNMNVTDLAKIQGAVPGLNISTFAGFNASNLVGIRGVTGLQLPIGTGQATAIYLDGVYLSRPDAAFFALDDLERVEVLRGPQGTLYGRNATAGAINIITRDPGREFRGGLDVSYGNYETLNARGSLSGPLAGGLSAGISGSYSRHDGYLTNVATGDRSPRRESYTLRGKLRYASPDGSFSAVLAGDVSRVTGADIFINPYVGTTLAGLAPYTEYRSDPATQAVTDLKTNLSGASLTLNYDAGGPTITSITSYRHFDNVTIGEADGGNILGLIAASNNRSNTFNQELRGVVSAGALRATIGANYYHEDAGTRVSIQSVTLPIDRFVIAESDLGAMAVFTQLEYDLTSRLTAVAGLRFNAESRHFVVDYTNSRTPGLRTPGTVSDETFIPTFGVNFKPTTDVLLYAKASEGYQAPGFNYSPGPLAIPNTFRAEHLWAYEIGAKTQLFDRRITLNLAAFYYDYSDLQARLLTSQTTTSVENAASATIKGFEGELVLRPIANFTLSGQVTYLDATYDDFCETVSGGTPLLGDAACVTSSGGAGGNRAGNRLPLAPRWAGGVMANYSVPVAGAGELALNAGYTFQTNSYFLANNDSLLETGGWDRLDARIGFTLKNGLEIYGYGRNLTDERYVGSGGRTTPTIALASVNEPRTYGVGARFRF